MHLSLSHKKMDSIMLFYALSSAAAVVTTITKSVLRKKQLYSSSISILGVSVFLLLYLMILW